MSAFQVFGPFSQKPTEEQLKSALRKGVDEAYWYLYLIFGLTLHQVENLGGEEKTSLFMEKLGELLRRTGESEVSSKLWRAFETIGKFRSAYENEESKVSEVADLATELAYSLMEISDVSEIPGLQYMVLAVSSFLSVADLLRRKDAWSVFG